MKGNPHYQKAVSLMAEAENAYSPEAADMFSRAAHTEATLALAFEQRTANLIQCSEKVYIRDSPDEIRTRLGAPTFLPKEEKK